MAWVETDSLSFTARHEDADTGYSHRLLDRLEDLRLRLEDRFDDVPGDVTVVIHDHPAWLASAHPLLPIARLLAAPAARRYLAGWTMAGEIHVLNEDWTERRAAGEDSLSALRGTADRLYVELVLAANNDELPPVWTPQRFLRYLRWAWLVQGAEQYFSGQVSMFRAAVRTRLREGPEPDFPPSVRDSLILGGTIFDLLEDAAGHASCEMLVSRLRRDGPRANLELAFDARFRDIERAWRSHLDRIADPRSTGLDGDTDAGVELRHRQREFESIAELDLKTDLDLEKSPELGGGLVEDPHERERERDGGEHPDQEPRRRADPWD